MPASFNRRILLRGLGGAVVAAPFLGSVAERWARGDSVGSAQGPKRLIVMFTYHGCITNRWFPAKSHGALTAADLNGTTLAPLAPFADKLLLPRGIRSMNEWTMDLSLGQGNDPLYQVSGSYFTCVPVSPHSDDPLDPLTPHVQPMPTAPSLDHVCIQQLLPPYSEPLLVNVANSPHTWRSAISFSAGNKEFRGTGSLSGLMNQLTGLFESSAPLSADSYKVARGQAVLDVVRADLETLERMDMSAADRRKLADWKDLLVMTTKAATPLCGVETAQTVSLGDASALPYSSEDASEKVTDRLDIADLYANVVALSAVCQASPVIFLRFPSSHTYTSLGVTTDLLFLGNRVGSVPVSAGSCEPGVTDQIHTVDQFHARKFAHLVDLLNSFDEGDGRLLDSTATVWFQQFSDGCAMNTNNLPIIQAGSCGGYFKTGQAINVFDARSDLYPGNSEECELSGVVRDFKALGTPPDIANAPINKY